MLADLVGAGSRYVLAQGGRGGLGNAALASPRRKAPGFALLGEPGDSADVVLELKTVADVGLIGYPSAGKSSLVAAMSAARPKIADYPFTTLVPNLGVVDAGEVRFTVADVPGLIPGASEGKGLGLEFLRHVERCSVLVHVLDCATLEPGRDPSSDLDVIENELTAYGPAWPTDPGSWCSTRSTCPRPASSPSWSGPSWRPAAAGCSRSALSPTRGCASCRSRMADIVRSARAAAAEPEVTRIVLRPKAVDEVGFRWRARATGSGSSARSRERWVRQTDFSNDEAVGYLADRLARLGVEDALRAAGARPGDAVVIGPLDDAVVFDWEPTVSAGAELLPGPRGTDARLDRR